MVEEEECDAKWVAEPVLAKSKDTYNKYTFAVDYRALNKNLVKYQYPLPRVDENLVVIGGKKIFSRIDIVKAFWSINIPESQRHHTSFRANGKLYRWERKTFGLKIGSSTFQKCIDKILESLRHLCAIAYIDDILVFSDTEEEHLNYL